jgi:hypothetical protein
MDITDTYLVMKPTELIQDVVYVVMVNIRGNKVVLLLEHVGFHVLTATLALVIQGDAPDDGGSMHL